MENIRAYAALMKVAHNNGISLEEVITEIEKGIRETIDTAKRENNLLALKRWKKIPSVGEYPTAVEFITYAVKQL